MVKRNDGFEPMAIPDGCRGLRIFMGGDDDPPRKDVVAHGLRTVRDWILWWARMRTWNGFSHDPAIDQLIPEEVRKSGRDGALVAYIDAQGRPVVKASSVWGRPDDAKLELEATVEECKVAAALDVMLEPKLRRTLVQVLAEQQHKVVTAPAHLLGRNGT